MNTGFYWYIGANLGKMCFLQVLQGLTNTYALDTICETKPPKETKQTKNETRLIITAIK